MRHAKAERFQSHGGYGDADYRMPGEEQADMPDDERANRQAYYKTNEDDYAPKECQGDCPSLQAADDIWNGEQ